METAEKEATPVESNTNIDDTLKQSEPTFTVTMSQLQQIKNMEAEMQNLRALLRQSELFGERVEPAKDYGLRKNLRMYFS